MSKRHQKSQTSVVPEPREDRKREHRRLRQKVRQDPYGAVVGGGEGAGGAAPPPPPTPAPKGNVIDLRN